MKPEDAHAWNAWSERIAKRSRRNRAKAAEEAALRQQGKDDERLAGFARKPRAEGQVRQLTGRTKKS